MSTDREEIVTHLCAQCGAPIKQIDLHKGHPFPVLTGPRWWWFHVDNIRNLSHWAQPAGRAMS